MYHYKLSWKTEYILILFLHNVTIYNQPQPPRSVFCWHLDVCKSSIYMIHLLLFLIKSYFNWVEKVTYSQSQFDKAQKSACCLRLFVFLRTWIIALFWHWRNNVCANGCVHDGSKCFFKLSIIMYYRTWWKIWRKDDFYNFKFTIYLCNA